MTSPLGPNTIPVGQTIPCFNVAGPLQIWVNTGAAYATQFLGWTRGGVSIQEQAFISELKSDLSGGEQGAPADFQYVGVQHTVEAELAQFNTGVLAALERRFNAAITPVTIGTLLSCSGANFRMLLVAANFGRLYTRVFVNEPITYAPVGTAVSFPRITFTCLQDLGNIDTSPYTVATSSSGALPYYTVSGSTVTFSPSGP